MWLAMSKKNEIVTTPGRPRELEETIKVHMNLTKEQHRWLKIKNLEWDTRGVSEAMRRVLEWAMETI